MIEHRLFGLVGQVDAADGDRDDFSAGGLVAADHFRKTAIFTRSNHETRAERAARDSELISHSFIVGPRTGGHAGRGAGRPGSNQPDSGQTPDFDRGTAGKAVLHS